MVWRDHDNETLILTNRYFARKRRWRRVRRLFASLNPLRLPDLGGDLT